MLGVDGGQYKNLSQWYVIKAPDGLYKSDESAKEGRGQASSTENISYEPPFQTPAGQQYKASSLI